MEFGHKDENERLELCRTLRIMYTKSAKLGILNTAVESLYCFSTSLGTCCNLRNINPKFSLIIIPTTPCSFPTLTLFSALDYLPNGLPLTRTWRGGVGELIPKHEFSEFSVATPD